MGKWVNGKGIVPFFESFNLVTKVGSEIRQSSLGDFIHLFSLGQCWGHPIPS